MTQEGGDGLMVDAEVRRGGFALTVTLAAAPGEVVGILGPNGAGKSTLLSALAGLTPVAAGRIVLAGQVIDDAGTGEFVEASGRPVGFVFHGDVMEVMQLRRFHAARRVREVNRQRLRLDADPTRVIAAVSAEPGAREK